MSHWYPTQSRIAELDAAAFEPPADVGVEVPDYSEILRAARAREWFPPHHAHQWVWLASQYRLHRGSGSDAERTSRRALEYLRGLAASPAPTVEDHRDLRWMLDASIRRLAPLVGAAQIRSCLSADERAAVEMKLAAYNTGAFHPENARAAVAAQLERIGEMVSGAYLTGVAAKIEALFSAAENGCPHSRAALAYLAEHDDAVPDSGGFLGLVDDVYVIEWAYAASAHETRCLPILEGLLRRFPHVGDVPLIGTPPRPLGAYTQYGVAAALHMLFDGDGSHVVSVLEAGPTPLLAAVFAAIECVRSHATDLDRDIASWPVGTPITLSDGTSTFRATYDGVAEFGGETKLRIGVKNATATGRGAIYLPTDVIPYIARASSIADGRLSKGSDITTWARRRYADPFLNVVGSARKALESQRCALYLGPRWKLADYLRHMRPMDGDVAARLGVCHAASKDKFEPYAGSVVDTPFLYTCSDASVAAALVADPPDHVESWRIVVDGADFGRALTAALAASGTAGNLKCCTFVELHDRDAAETLFPSTTTSIVLEDLDVQPSPTAPWRAADEDGLVRALTRQSNYWTATHEFEECRSFAFEALAASVREMRTTPDESAERRNLELAVSALVRRALASPIAASKPGEALATLVKQAAMLAAPLRLYNPTARSLYTALQHTDVTSGAFCDRTDDLRRLAAKTAAGERAAVLCRSEPIAEAYREQFRADPIFNRINWTTIQNIRRNAPLEKIIVPGWFDKATIRELALAGFAETTTFLFFPFERDWFNATLNAQRRWERRVDALGAPHLRALAEHAGLGRDDSRLWRPQIQIRATAVDDFSEPVPDEEADHDWIELRAVAALDHALPKVARSNDTVKAHLIVFEGGTQYVCLPPAAEVIVLSGRDERARERSHANAENYLYSQVTELKRGMVLAFAKGGDRDLLDARADEFIEHADATRGLAGLWRTALKRHLTHPIEASAAVFAKRMAEAGHNRTAWTVRAWVTQTGTVAPRNSRALIPLIARLTGDGELTEKMNQVLSAVEAVYRARARAAAVIVEEIFSGNIDTDQPELTVDVAGHELRFALHRVLTVRPAQIMPNDLVGRISTFSTGASH